MLASNVNVRAMTSATECFDMIDQIEKDHQNTIGGISAFVSGKKTFLKKTAIRKIEALERRAFVDFDEEE